MPRVPALSLPALAASAVLAWWCGPAAAQAPAWPAKPVKIIVTAPPGGPPDVLSRALAQKLQERLGQVFIVENRPGANTIIGMDACAKAVPDGSTFCISTNDSVSVNPHLYAKLPYDAAKSFEPVAILAWPVGVIVATAASGAKTFAEVVSLSKAKPNTLNWGSFGNGSTSHLYLEWIKSKTDWDVSHVPYNSTATMLQAALAGQIQLTYLSIGPLRAHIDSGKLVPIAVAGLQRSGLLPNVPTFAEVGLGDYFVRSWFGLFAPAGTAAETVLRLNAAAMAIVAEPEFQKATLQPLTLQPGSGSPKDTADYMARDRIAGGELVKAAKVKLD